MTHREPAVQHGNSSRTAPICGPLQPPRLAQLSDLPQLADTAELAALVGRQLASCRRYGTRLAVLVIAVDALAQRHGVLEAPVMKALLQAMGARLRGRLRGTDLVAQLGEQGFGVVLLGAASADVPAVQARLRKALSGPYGIEEQLLYVGLRIGAAAYPEVSVSGLDLVRAAEALLD